MTREVLSDRSAVQAQLPRDPPPRPSLLVQGNNTLLLVHFELIHHPKCSKNRNTQANASPQKWPILTRNSLAGFARKLTRKSQNGWTLATGRLVAGSVTGHTRHVNSGTTPGSLKLTITSAVGLV